MEPCGPAILEAINSIWREPFHYLELGIASGDTLATVARHLQGKGRYVAVGVDIEDGWSLNKADLERNIAGLPHVLLSFEGSGSYLARDLAPFDFILIDACHGLACCQADFHAASLHIRTGGIICFHDSDQACQGQDQQPHCGRPIEVRQAVTDLKLLSGQRIGWDLIADLPGTETGRGCVMVRRNC